MNVITLDYETYWDSSHSLSKMPAMSYVMHPDTEIQSCAVKLGEGPTRVVFGETSLRKLFSKLDWHNSLVLSHNNEGFDSMITAWRFGVKPKMWGCTMAMARPVFAKTAGCSLKAVGAVLCPELGAKGSLEATNTKGKRLADFTPDELEAMRVYNVQDVELCYGIFKALLPQTGAEEMKQIDATIRMLVEPQFELDMPLLKKSLKAEVARKHAALMDVATLIGAYEAGMTDEEAAEAARKTLASAPQFARLLTDLGVEVPTKPSPSDPEKMIPALAKTDQAFIDLQEHEDPVVAGAACARLGVKSTILETRIGKFLEVGELLEGKFPVPTRYYGADTTGRRSGWMYNPLNLPRVDPKNPKASDTLRNSMRAPKGYKVVVADLSGIELRMAMFMWKVPYAMELFAKDRANADLYRFFAANHLYGVEEAAVTKQQRQVAKVAMLGLQYGAGAATFRKVAKIMGRVDLDEAESAKIVGVYREAHPEIVRGWRRSQDALEYMYTGESAEALDPWGLALPVEEGIRSPKGRIRYPGLRREKSDTGKDEWVYGEGRHKARIYGPKCVENQNQHLSRFVIADALLEMKRRTGLFPAMEVYDELVYVVPEAEADQCLKTLLGVMRTPPKWFPQLLVWAEGDIADTYGAAK